MPKGVPLTADRVAAKQREIAAIAERLFTEQGFADTSMRQIADASGVGKSTLYDYFDGKDNVLAFVLEERLTDLMQRGEVILEGEGSAHERLRQLMRMHLDVLLRHEALFLQVLAEGQRLRPESIRRIQACRYAYQDLVRRFLETGIEEGEFRHVSAAMTTKMLMSMMTPVIWTSRPVGTPAEMLEEALDILTGGLLQ